MTQHRDLDFQTQYQPMRAQRPSKTGGRIIALAAALWLCMLPLRAMVVGYVVPADPRVPAVSKLPEMLLIGVYDFAYVAAITVVALVALALIGRGRFMRGLIFFVFLLVAILSLFSCLANVQIVPMLGRPFNYQWLYYSDFLRSMDAKQAIDSVLYTETGKLNSQPIIYAGGFVAAMIALMIILRLLASA